MATHPPVYPPCPIGKKGQLQREEPQRSDQTLRSGSRARISKTHQCQECDKLTSVPRCQAVRTMGHDAHKGGHKDARDGGQHVGHGHQGT